MEEEDGEGRSMHLLADGEGFFKFKERGVESGDEKCKVNRERERETGG